MKFRVPEVFLGAFLTIAVFAVGLLFASSGLYPQRAMQTIASEQTEKHREKAKTPDEELVGSTWLTKDAAGFFTFWLVIVGAGQVILFYVQLRLIRRSLDDAKIAADAAICRS